MRGGRHHLLSGLVAVWLTASGLGVRVGAAAGSAEDVDDPKMFRVFQAPRPAAAPSTPRPTVPLPAKPSPPPPALTPRNEVAKPPTPTPVRPLSAAPPAVAVPPATAVRAAPAPATPSAPPAATVPAAPAPNLHAPPAVALNAEPDVASPRKSPPSSAAGEDARPNAPAVDVAARDAHAGDRAEPPAAGREWSYAPRLKLAYRRFPFVRVGDPAGATTTPTSTSESFESVSIDVYPISSLLRVGLSTQFGWESSKFDRSGDYFIAESASVGFQWPGRITPFVEGLAGAGYMRRTAADWNLPTAYWQVGIDAGIEVYLAKRAYVSLAVGYLHPGNLFLRDQSLMSVKTDSWSLKFGVGI